MLTREIQTFLLNKEYHAEKNISLVRTIYLAAMLLTISLLSVQNSTDYPSILILLLSGALVLSIIVLADVVLLYRNSRTSRFIKMAKYLSTPLDLGSYGFIAWFLYLQKNLFITKTWGITLILLSVCALTMFLSVFRLSVITSILNLVLIIPSYIYLNYWIQDNYQFSIIRLINIRIYDSHELIFYASVLIFTFIAILMIVSRRKNLSTVTREQWLRRFIPPTEVNAVLKGKKEITIPDKKVEATVLCSEIRLFTAITEKNKPENVIRFFNHVLEEMSEIIYKHDGMLDRIGEGSFRAVFGLPFENPMSAENAVRAAFAMNKAADELRLGIPIHLGTGIHTGKVTAGYVGVSHHMNYTILGDTITTAMSVLELTKQTKHSIIISEPVRALLPQGIDARKLGNAKIKGKDEGVTVYTPIAH